MESLKEGARSLGDEARERASDYVEGGKQAVTDSLEAFAQAIRRASDELSERDQTMAAQLIRQGAGTLERVTRSIEGTSLEDMIRQVRRFARNNPTAFIGGAMLVGFAVARFARASSQPETGDWNRSGSSWRGDDRGYGSEEWSGGGAGSSGYAGEAGSYGSGGGSYGSGSGSAGSFGGGGYGSSGTGGSSFGSSGTGSSYPSNTGGAGEVPPGSQGYGGGGMGTDPIQSSGPSSETDESMTSTSGSGSGLGSSSISTGGNR